MIKDQIHVIGGYGQVGQTVCRILGKRYPGKVIAAGTRLEKAEAFCRTTEGTVQPLQLNINEPVRQDTLNSIKLVIMCLDQSSTGFIETCIDSGTNYIDISANYSFLVQVQALDDRMKERGSTAV